MSPKKPKRAALPVYCAAEPIIITVRFENTTQASYLAMFLKRCGFEEFYAQTEPHLPAAQRKERAYAMIAAASKVENALEAADVPLSVY